MSILEVQMIKEDEWWRKCNEKEYSERIFKAKEDYHKRMTILPFEEKLMILKELQEFAEVIREGDKIKRCPKCGSLMRKSLS